MRIRGIDESELSVSEVDFEEVEKPEAGDIIKNKTPNEGFKFCIDLKGNNLNRFPGVPEFLRELDIGYNLLREMPMNISKQMVYLTKLHLSVNNFDRIPDSVRDLRNLTLLDMSGNRFVTMDMYFSM